MPLLRGELGLVGSKFGLVLANVVPDQMQVYITSARASLTLTIMYSLIVVEGCHAFLRYFDNSLQLLSTKIYVLQLLFR